MKPNLASLNAYEILGVSRAADLAAVRRAFRALAIQHHPDAKPTDEKRAAAETFARINRAHEILRDPEERRKYDDMLDRGALPNLDQELSGQAAFSSLAEILGEVRSLGISDESDELTATILLPQFREMLKSALISGPGFKEGVIDVMPFLFIEGGDGFRNSVPLRELEQLGRSRFKYVVTTELRLIFLIEYFREWTEGGRQYTQSSFQLRAIPFESVGSLKVREVGRRPRVYAVEVETADGAKLEMQPHSGISGVSFETVAYHPNRLTRLFLVATAHRLPLRVEIPEQSWTADATMDAGIGFAPIAAWCVPFLLTLVVALLRGVSDSGLGELLGLTNSYMNDSFATTAVLYLVPLLVGWRIADRYAAWALRRPEDVFEGPLDADLTSPSANPAGGRS